MSESSSDAASSPGAQATERLYTADDVRELMTCAWFDGYEWLTRDKHTTQHEDVERLLAEFDRGR